jgi:NAD kinase
MLGAMRLMGCQLSFVSWHPLMAEHPVPVLGINFGTVGFLVEPTQPRWQMR